MAVKSSFTPWMPPNEMPECEIVESDWGNDQRALLDFFNENIKFFKNVHVERLSHVACRQLADKVMCSSLCENDWMDIAASLGCYDVTTLKRIDYWAKQNQQLPFYRFLTEEYYKQNGSIEMLIIKFIKLRRYDLLVILKPFIEGLIPEINELAELEAVISNQEQCHSLYNSKEVQEISTESGFHESFNSQNESKSSASETHSFHFAQAPSIETKSTCSQKALKTKSGIGDALAESYSTSIEENEDNKMASCEDSKEIMNDQDSRKIINGEDSPEESDSDSRKIINGENSPEESDSDSRKKNNQEDSPEESDSKSNKTFSIDRNSLTKTCLFNCFGKMSNGDKITVFITHTEDDFQRAIELSVILTENYGFEVYIQGEQDAIFAYDPWYIIQQIVEYVDFIVPLVSNQYLEEITPSTNPNDFSTDRLNVRYIFQSFQNNFVNQHCLNKKIRPLMVDGVDLRKMKKYVEFKCCLKIELQLSRFAKLLINSKQLYTITSSTFSQS